MKKNRLTIIITAILIIIAGVLLWNNRYLSSLRGDAYDFTVRDTASVTRMFFADKSGNTVLLERQDTGWTVNGKYEAQPQMIDNILYTLDKLRIKMPVALSSHNNVIRDMAGTNTKVEIYQIVPRINLFNKIKLFPHETITKVFYIGNVTQDNSGTYVLKEGADKAYIVHLHGFRGFVSSRFSTDEEDWRKHTIYSTEMRDIASFKLEFKNSPGSGFVINRIGDLKFEMKHLDGTPVDVDTIRMLNLLNSFKDARFEAFLTDIAENRRDSIINSPFEERLTLVTKDGTESVVTTYPMKPKAPDYLIEEFLDDDIDHKYAYITNDDELVMIQEFAFSKFLQSVDYYKKGNRNQKMIYVTELEEIPSR